MGVGPRRSRGTCLERKGGKLFPASGWEASVRRSDDATQRHTGRGQWKFGRAIGTSVEPEKEVSDEAASPTPVSGLDLRRGA